MLRMDVNQANNVIMKDSIIEDVQEIGSIVQLRVKESDANVTIENVSVARMVSTAGASSSILKVR